ncbi:MAG: type IV pili methyl-accepting chemotaxis transducer N-terminal domain-containing protein [Pseudomonadota bacterium]
MVTRRGFVSGGICVVGLAATVLPVQAIGGETRRRIDLAGFQRTRLILIKRAACFAQAGIDVEKDFDIIREMTAEFTDVMRALQWGSNDLGIARENHARVIDALREVSTLWLPYSERAAAVAEARSMSDDDFSVLVEKERPLYETMNTAVGAIERTYGGDSVPLHPAFATNLAGRQRSLGQQIASDVCLVGIDYKGEEARSRIAESMALFGNTHTALSQGKPMLGIRGPVQPALASQYKVIETLWSKYKALAGPVAEGGAVDETLIRKVGAASDALLAASDAAVKLFPGES